MITLTPILLAVGFALMMFRFSAWRIGHQLTAQSTLLKDPLLTHLADRMAGAADLPKIDVYVHETATINGLAAPDGRIFLTRGFLDKYRLGEVTADELASVIAHELGHVALGHSRRRMIDFSAQNAIRVVLAMVIGRIIPVAGVWIANTIASMLAARLSRQDEFEADAYAAALLTKSGLGVAGQKSLLAKLGRLTGAAGSPPVWLASHPSAEDRVKAIATLEDRWKGKTALS
jgi:putative metalloprotease